MAAKRKREAMRNGHKKAQNAQKKDQKITRQF
jgi:hypothetical protein